VAAVLALIVMRVTQPGPFFLDVTGKTIVKFWFVAQVRDILRRISLPQDQYAGYSFHIGLATSAALVGGIRFTQTFGRWHCAAFLQGCQTRLWLAYQELSSLVHNNYLKLYSIL